jgi:tripartite-type tricarboxylate transporter receptor subunit TctC
MALVQTRATVAVAAAVTLAAAAAEAQSWPTRQVMFVVPFAAGGGTDAFARPIAAQLDKQLGQRVLIENRAGAGGTAGAAVAAKAAPDGYTWFVGAAHHTIAPSIYPRLSYDIEKDFVPVAVLAQPPHVIVVNPQKSTARTVKELIEQAKAEPGKLQYGSAGNGTTHHLAGELFKQLTGTNIAHVPYRGAGPAMQDLVAGHITMIFDGLGTSAPTMAAGQIRGLAVTAGKRVAAFPDLPTAAEAGLAGFEFSTWYGLWALRGTPADIVERMGAEIAKALQENSIREAWVRNGSEVPSISGEAMARLVRNDIETWGQVVRKSGVKIEGG